MILNLLFIFSCLSLSCCSIVLYVKDEGAHEAIAAALWESESVEEAIATLESLAACNLETWQEADRQPSRRAVRASDYADDEATDDEVEQMSSHVAG